MKNAIDENTFYAQNERAKNALFVKLLIAADLVWLLYYIKELIGIEKMEVPYSLYLVLFIISTVVCLIPAVMHKTPLSQRAERNVICACHMLLCFLILLNPTSRAELVCLLCPALSCLYFDRAFTIVTSVSGYFLYCGALIWRCFLPLRESDSAVMLGELLSTLLAYTIIYALFAVAFIATANITKVVLDKQKLADHANEAKSAFLANMSHEIRTPMNAIVGMSDLIIQSNDEDEKTEYAKTIKSSSQNLLGIINDILDFSKIESGKMEIIPVEYYLSSIIHDLSSMINIRIRDTGKDIAFNIELAGDIPDGLVGDEIRIKQIFINVINNSVKFTHKGKITVNLSWEKTGENSGILCASVKDTGIGIKQEDLGKLFESFSQVDTKKNRQIEGSGLGLSICKELLEMMGGGIKVESEYGKWTCVSFALPQKVFSKEVVELNAHIKEEKEFQYPFFAPAASILVVDDNKTNLLVASGLLGKYKVQITTATSGFEALALMRSAKRFDIIFMDHMMPIMDGVDTTVKIRALDSEYARNIPIIALTANAIKGVEKLFIEAGMNDFVAKPIDIQKLAEIMVKWVPKEKQLKLNCVEAAAATPPPAPKPSGVSISPAFAAFMNKVKSEPKKEEPKPEEPAEQPAVAKQTEKIEKTEHTEQIEQPKPVEPPAPEKPAEPAPNVPAPEPPQGRPEIVPENKSDEERFGKYYPLFVALRGVDYENGIRQSGNDTHFYYELLKIFAEANTISQIDTVFRRGNLKEYIVEVHGIKGAARNINASTLAYEALQLELAAKDSNEEYVKEHHGEMLREYRMVVNSIFSGLDKLDLGYTFRF